VGAGGDFDNAACVERGTGMPLALLLVKHYDKIRYVSVGLRTDMTY
jgi:hypothetical protein